MKLIVFHFSDFFSSGSVDATLTDANVEKLKQFPELQQLFEQRGEGEPGELDEEEGQPGQRDLRDLNG